MNTDIFIKSKSLSMAMQHYKGRSAVASKA